MVQRIKQKVQDKIDAAALEMFFLKGFRQTTMADIAREANISVGNIYRYYPRKETLFLTIIPENLVKKLESLVKTRFHSVGVTRIKQLEVMEEKRTVDDELKGFFMKYRKHFVIIMNKSRGTRYEAYKDRIIDFLVRNALDFFKSSDSPHPINTDKATVHLIRIIYSNMVHGFISIAQTFESEQEIERSYQLLLEYHYFGIRQFV